MALAVLMLSALPARADGPVDGDAFEAMAEGHTLYFRQGTGAPLEYGAEQYFDGRRARWRYADGECTDGIWWEEDGLICFAYETSPAPQCWHFEERGGRFRARLADVPPGDASELLLDRIDDEPLDCPGPDTGV